MNVNKCTEEESSSLYVAGSKKSISKWFFSCFLMKANFFSLGPWLGTVGSWGRVASRDKVDAITKSGVLGGVCMVWWQEPAGGYQVDEEITSQVFGD